PLKPSGIFYVPGPSKRRIMGSLGTAMYHHCQERKEMSPVADDVSNGMQVTDRDVPLIEVDSVTIRVAGDSGDGSQLTGTSFADASAVFGNDIATFNDFPAEIRAPAG